MRQRRERIGLPGQAKACGQQRDVEGQAVVADEQSGARQLGGDRLQIGRLRVETGQQELAQRPTVFPSAQQTGHEGPGPRAAGQAAGLGIQADEIGHGRGGSHRFGLGPRREMRGRCHPAPIDQCVNAGVAARPHRHLAVSAVSDKPPLKAEDAGGDLDCSDRFGQDMRLWFMRTPGARLSNRHPPEALGKRRAFDRRGRAIALFAETRRLST
ncbi:hypothetical protein THIOKS11570034 [Thiocapsa sp. KS1]|nr:hypothetical protein THIOKS11570034 [Thiocapsa sp. KS1]